MNKKLAFSPAPDYERPPHKLRNKGPSMTDNKIETREERDTAERQAWQRPELKRLDTRDAEAAAGIGGDSGVYS